MHLEGTMHQWVMTETTPFGQVPGKLGMQTLIVAHHPRFEVIKASEDHQEDQDDIDNCLEIYTRRSLEETFSPGLAISGCR